MDKLQLENMKFNLNKRILLFTELEAQLAAAGHIFRQIGAIDKRLRESFSADEVTFPEEFKPIGFRNAVNAEFDFQLKEGDPPRDSFQAAMAVPRITLTGQMDKIHNRLLAGKREEEDEQDY